MDFEAAALPEILRTPPVLTQPVSPGTLDDQVLAAVELVKYPEIDAPDGIVTVPVNVGLATVEYPWALTKAVVATEVSLSDVAGVGAFGSPEKVGLARVA